MKPHKKLEGIIGKYLSYVWLEKDWLYIKPMEMISTKDCYIEPCENVENTFTCKNLQTTIKGHRQSEKSICYGEQARCL